MAAVLPITPSTTTASQISVSSSVATSLNLSTSTGVAFPVYVQIQNQDTLNPIFCSDSSSVAISGSHSGFEIAAAAEETFTLPQSEQFYCIAKTASVSAVVIRSQ
ncbi:MAG: hypothetical protein KGJ13_04670 [Patescibacteria group bacterium]|nr:hypothetical protein [Patescibacteria group bacterium]